MKKELKKILTEANASLGEGEVKFEVGYPKDENHGDFMTNLALVLAKKKGESPRELAEDLKAELEAREDFSSNFEAEVAGPGFINFRLKEEAFLGWLQKTVADEAYGKSQELKGQRIMVEYAQPNPFKSFHVGHLRNLIVGEAVSRALENAGAEVIRTNYQGDIGLHVAKCFWGLFNNQEFNKEGADWGENSKERREWEAKNLISVDEKVNYLARCYVLGSKAYKEEPEAKKEIEVINGRIYKKDEAGNEAIKVEWAEKRQWSLDKFEEIYKRTGARFDRLYFESEMFEPGIKLCEEAKEKGVLIEDDGCLIFDGEKHGLNPRVFLNKLGLPTYEAKELGLGYRELKDFGELDKVIHVVGNEQINYFKVLFLAQRLFDDKLFDDKEYHLAYGLVSLKGMKMSSREGNIVLGEDILNAAFEEIMQLLRERKEDEVTAQERDEIAEAVGVGAVKYSFLKIGTLKDMVFDLAESVRLEGQSGPYIMYSYVRAGKILKKAGVVGKKDWGDLGGDLSAEEKRLLLLLMRLPAILKKPALKYQLAPVAEYAYELASVFAAFYDKQPVLKEENEAVKEMRLALVCAFYNSLGRCLEVLGMERIEKM